MAVTQQINLFHSGLLRKKDPLSAQRALGVVAVAICLLLAVSGYTQWRVHRLARQMAAAQAKLKQSEQHLAQLQKRFAPKKKSQLLEEEIQRLQREKTARRNLLARVGSMKEGNAAGFSGFLEALARQNVPGLWLRRISLGGGDVTLAGSAQRPAQVPRYLQQLSRKQVFQGLEFNQFQLGRSKAGTLDFLLKTASEKKDESRK